VKIIADFEVITRNDFVVDAHARWESHIVHEGNIELFVSVGVSGVGTIPITSKREITFGG